MAIRYRIVLFILFMPFLGLALLWLGTRIWVVHVESSYPPLGRFVELSDSRIHVLEAGEGTPVVLLHGASSNLREWQASIFDRVADHHHAIAIDRPGHGWSERNGADDHDPRVQAEMVHAVLKELGVTQPVFVAHSFAGTVALAYALAYPGDVGGVLFLSGVSHPWPGGVGWFQDVSALPVVGSLFANTLFVPGYLAGREAAIEKAFSPNTVPAGYASEAGVALYARPASITANAKDIVELKPIVAAMAERYHTLDVPLTVMTGDADQVIWTHLHSGPLAEKVEGAELLVLEGVGHMPHHARPDAVLSAIDALVEKRKSPAVTSTD